MLQFVRHPGAWRYRAALTRVAAEHGANVHSKEHELRLAALYERLARYAEERVSYERASRRLLPAPRRAGLLAAPHERDGQALGGQEESTAHDLLKAAGLL